MPIHFLFFHLFYNVEVDLVVRIWELQSWWDLYLWLPLNVAFNARLTAILLHLRFFNPKFLERTVLLLHAGRFCCSVGLNFQLCSQMAEDFHKLEGRQFFMFSFGCLPLCCNTIKHVALQRHWNFIDLQCVFFFFFARSAQAMTQSLNGVGIRFNFALLQTTDITSINVFF